MAIEEVTCGSIFLWSREIKKNGSPWTTASAVVLVFQAPGATTTTTVTLTLASGTTWTGLNLATLFNAVGYWNAWEKVTDSGKDTYHGPEQFYVAPSPTQLS